MSKVIKGKTLGGKSGAISKTQITLHRQYQRNGLTMMPSGVD
jgi:hypothetical protein